MVARTRNGCARSHGRSVGLAVLSMGVNKMSDLTDFIVDRSNEARTLDEIVKLMQDLEEGDTVRVVSASQDVMARVVNEVEVWRDWEDDLIVEVPVKIYGDTEYEHRRDYLAWIGFGPVDFSIPGEAERERVDEVHVM